MTTIDSSNMQQLRGINTQINSESGNIRAASKRIHTKPLHFRRPQGNAQGVDFWRNRREHGGALQSPMNNRLLNHINSMLEKFNNLMQRLMNQLAGQQPPKDPAAGCDTPNSGSVDTPETPETNPQDGIGDSNDTTTDPVCDTPVPDPVDQSDSSTPAEDTSSCVDSDSSIDEPQSEPPAVDNPSETPIDDQCDCACDSNTEVGEETQIDTVDEEELDEPQAAFTDLVWRPAAKRDGNVVVVLPKSLQGQIKAVKIKSDGKVLEKGKLEPKKNGRTYIRFDKPGSKYPSPLKVVVTLKDGTSKTYTIKHPETKFKK